MIRTLSTFLLVILLVGPVTAQEGSSPGLISPAATNPNVKADATPVVKLPASLRVSFDEGMVSVQAETEGEVEWLVLTAAKLKKPIKYKRNDADKAIDIAIPVLTPIQSYQITVYCWSAGGNKPTPASRCDIFVDAPDQNTPYPAPQPAPGPQPGPNPAPIPQGNLILTVVYDPTNVDPSYTLISKWADTKDKLIAAGHKPYLQSIKSAAVQAWLNKATAQNAEFGAAVKQAGIPMIIAQDSKARVLGVVPCPKTEAELIKLLAGGN